MAKEKKDTGKGVLEFPGGTPALDVTEQSPPPRPEVASTETVAEQIDLFAGTGKDGGKETADTPGGDPLAEINAAVQATKGEVGVDNREPWKMTQEELEARQAQEKAKAKRGRKSKGEKADPEAPKGKQSPTSNGDKATKENKGKSGRPKADKGKAAGGLGDKVSQSKGGKMDAPIKGGSDPLESLNLPFTQPDTPPRPVEQGNIVYLKISELHPFHTYREHPYKVTDDDRMEELRDTIKTHGVMTPATVRPEKDGNGYEIIAGHRRCHASELAGLEELPCIVREMSDIEAVREMKISNKQRGDPLPSELARLLDLEVEAIKHQGGKLEGVDEGDIGKRSVEIVGRDNDMNYKKVMRYIRLNSLVPELLDMVDNKKMGFMPAVELSYVKPKNQRLIAVSIEGEQSSPSVAQAKKLRELDAKDKLTGDVIDGILSEQKKEVDNVIITTAELNKYFGDEATPRQMKDQIIALLDDWKKAQEKDGPAHDTAERD